LVIAYEFPPTAGPGVQRITALTKYLRRLGWRVSVVCADPIASAPLDDSMLADVDGVSVVSLPGRHVATAIARMLSPLKRAKSSGTSSVASAPGTSVDAAVRRPLSGRISRWIAVPDDALLWQGAAIRAALVLNRKDPFDVVFASGPPYSAMLAGCDISRAIGVPVALDMRDAWRDNAAIHWPTAWHRRRSLALERGAMRDASAVVVVSEPSAEEARSLGATDVSVLTNGFDPERVPAWTPDSASPLTLAFMGRFSRALTDPEPLFAGMALAAERSEAAARIRLVVVGPEYPWIAELIARYGIADRVELRGYLPNAEALGVVATADVGVIVLADASGTRGIYPSKLFDYLGISIPILLAGPTDGITANLIAEANAGILAEPDAESVATALIGIADAKASGHAIAEPKPDVVARYSRETQAAVLSDLLERIATVRR